MQVQERSGIQSVEYVVVIDSAFSLHCSDISKQRDGECPGIHLFEPDRLKSGHWFCIRLRDAAERALRSEAAFDMSYDDFAVFVCP
jgi:hypothetical protein